MEDSVDMQAWHYIQQLEQQWLEDKQAQQEYQQYLDELTKGNEHAVERSVSYTHLVYCITP